MKDICTAVAYDADLGITHRCGVENPREGAHHLGDHECNACPAVWGWKLDNTSVVLVLKAEEGK